MTEEFDINGLHCKKWLADNEKAVLQVIHGLGEMTEYYEQLADFMTENGVSVYMSELRSHGRTVRSGSEGDVIMASLEDAKELTEYIAEKTDAPMFLLGHSLGQLMVQFYLKNGAERFSGAVLTGCVGFDSVDWLLESIDKEISEKGEDVPCMDTFGKIFGHVIGYFPEKCTVSWVTTDLERAEYYEKLPYTNVMYTNRFYKGFLNAAKQSDMPDFFDDAKSKLPVLIASGTEDLVGDFGRFPISKAGQMSISGYEVTLRMYKGMRHSILQEKNRNTVFSHILKFIFSLCNA